MLKKLFIKLMHTAASVRETRIVTNNSPARTRITPKLATAIRYLIYKHSTFFGHKANLVFPNAIVLWWL